MTVVGKVVDPSRNTFWHVRYQFLAVICVNLITVSYGLVAGWSSPAFLILTSADTPMNDGPLSTEMISWLGAVSNLGAVFGNFFYSWLTTRFGRKVSVALLAVPNILWWISVYFIRDSVYLIPMRIFVGIAGGGSFICVPLYVAEIASDHVRGTLGSILTISFNSGIFISYVAGAYLAYDVVPIVLVFVPIVFLVGALLLPETPQYLITHSRPEDAIKALKFYKACSGKSDDDLRRYRIELDRLQAYAKIKENEQENVVRFADFRQPAAYRGMLIGVTMMALNIFTGSLLMLSYAGTIFEATGSDIDPNTSAIILISVQILGTCFAMVLIDRFGRRTLLMLSTTGTAIGMFSMATYSFLEYSELDMTVVNWLPVTSLSLALLMSSMGLLPLTFVVVAEVLPIKIREVGSTYCLCLVSLFLFIAAKFYPSLAEAIGMYSCFWFFSGVSLFGLFFAIFILPETMGKNLNKT